MKLAIDLGPPDANWQQHVTYAIEAERLGVDFVWCPELWGYDAVTPLAYLAAKTSRIKLGTGIMQIGARTPAMTAMTAMTMAALSDDRFILGLGVSGPQVMEGWHGIRFSQPLQRTREMVEIVRKIMHGERLTYEGKMYQLPLPGGEGKALVSIAQPRPQLPVYLATLGPKNLELTGEIANGWLGTSFIPEHASLFFDAIERGARKVGRALTDIDVQVNGGVVAFSDDLDSLIAPRKAGLAFTLGAMGSRQHNFYNEVYQRAGYADTALQVQDLWLNRQRDAAIALVPDELVLKTNLLGTKEMVRERLRIHKKAGVNALRVSPDGETLDKRLSTLEQLVHILNQINAETSL